MEGITEFKYVKYIHGSDIKCFAKFEDKFWLLKRRITETNCHWVSCDPPKTCNRLFKDVTHLMAINTKVGRTLWKA